MFLFDIGNKIILCTFYIAKFQNFMNEWKSLQHVHVNFIHGTSESTKTSFGYENLKNGDILHCSIISDHCPVGRKDPDPIHHSLSTLISKYSCRHKPARGEPSIQCQPSITALTSIQNPHPSSKLLDALRNSASLD